MCQIWGRKKYSPSFMRTWVQSINQSTAETARVRRADLLCPRPTASHHMWSISLGRPSCWAHDDRGRPLGLFQPGAGAGPPLELMTTLKSFFCWGMLSARRATWLKKSERRRWIMFFAFNLTSHWSLGLNKERVFLGFWETYLAVTFLRFKHFFKVKRFSKCFLKLL